MILLSFDIEEFDMPFEYGKEISFSEQIIISTAGCHLILDLLKKHGFIATFFSTVTFALNAPDVISRIKDEGHELASHAYYHSEFETEHLALSKQKLEELFGKPIMGFRMPRMMPVDNDKLERAGYTYNSSINPTWLPGRYNNLKVSRTYFRKKNVWQLPASVSPMRIPLFWLSFHNFPLSLYKYLVKRTYQKDGYINIYFHPWEFTPLNDKDKFGFPSYVSRNSGTKMYNRMDTFLKWLNEKKYPNCTICEFVEGL
ncbi:MAG: DUF3473 domain-containing protein [Pedobacter sp.]|nr:MAG: DUF3473 domain-containing protein [Pedobacter sp.]